MTSSHSFHGTVAKRAAGDAALCVARIVVAKGGPGLAIEADPDYTRRPEPEETLSVLRKVG